MAKNEVATQNSGAVAPKQSFSTELTNALMGVKEALPKDFNVPRFVQNAVSLLNGNKQLAEFAKKNGTQQIKQGLMLGAFLGLDFMNTECHLIAYGNELNFQKDYRGVRKLIMKYSITPVKDVYAMLIREGDFVEEFVNMGERSINFKPIPLSNAKVIGAFAVVLYKDGSCAYDIMNYEELENTRKHSKASNSMAWKDFTGEMYKKTVIHRLSKQIPLEFENPKQKEAFMADMEIETDTAKIVEMEIVENANQIPFEETPQIEEKPPMSTTPKETAEKEPVEMADGKQVEMPDFMKAE